MNIKLIIIGLFFVFGNLFSQDYSKIIDSTKQCQKPALFGQLTIGFFERNSALFGVYLNEHHSLAFKFSNNFNSIIYPTIGVRYSFVFHDNNILNNFSIGYSKLLKSKESAYNKTMVGDYYEFNIGKSNFNGTGFSVLYEVGLSATKKLNEDFVFLPNIKIGTNYNFPNDYFEPQDNEHLNARVFARIGIGIGEFATGSIGYNLNKMHSIELQTANIISGTFLSTSWSSGLKYTFSKESKFILKNISVAYSFLYLEENSFEGFGKHGYSIEITTGRRKNYQDWINYYYEIGILRVQPQAETAVTTFILKFGYNINLLFL